MMTRYRVLGGLSALFLLAGSASADLRVLFRFDDSTVQVYRVVPLDEATEFPEPSVAKSLSAMPEGLIVMRWLDSNGELLTNTQVMDPRVSHSPNHTDLSVLSQHGLVSGGWIATAPDSAESVIVEMPEKSALGLAAETWSLSLSGN